VPTPLFDLNFPPPSRHLRRHPPRPPPPPPRYRHWSPLFLFRWKAAVFSPVTILFLSGPPPPLLGTIPFRAGAVSDFRVSRPGVPRPIAAVICFFTFLSKSFSFCTRADFFTCCMVRLTAMSPHIPQAVRMFFSFAAFAPRREFFGSFSFLGRFSPFPAPPPSSPFLFSVGASPLQVTNAPPRPWPPMFLHGSPPLVLW